jgi:hypothetical protein
MTHVDLVKNDYQAEAQVLVGRVYLIGDGIKIETADEHLERILAEPLYDPESGATVDPSDGPAFVQLLSRKWDGSYVLATKLHEDSECPFATTDRVPVVSTDLVFH